MATLADDWIVPKAPSAANDDWVVPQDDWVVPQEAPAPREQYFGEVAPDWEVPDSDLNLLKRAQLAGAATIPGFIRAKAEGQRAALIEELKERSVLDRDPALFERLRSQKFYRSAGAVSPTRPLPRSQEELVKELDELDTEVEENSQLWSDYQKDLQALQPKNASILAQGIGAAAESIAPTLAGIVVSRLSVPLGIKVGMTGGAVQAFTSSYNQARQGGATHEQATARGSASATYEMLGERVGMGALLAPAQKVLRKLGVAIAANAGEEAATEAADTIDEYLRLKPNATLGEVVKALAERVPVAAVAGAAGAAAVSPVISAMERAQVPPEQQALERAARLDMEANLRQAGQPDAIARQLLAPLPLPEAPGVGIPPTALPQQEAAIQPTGAVAPEPGPAITPPAPIQFQQGEAPTGAFLQQQPTQGRAVVTAPPQGLVEEIVASPKAAAEIALAASPLETGTNPLLGAREALAQGLITQGQFDAFQRKLEKTLNEKLGKAEQQFDDLTDEYERIAKKLEAVAKQPAMPLLPYEKQELELAEQAYRELSSIGKEPDAAKRMKAQEQLAVKMASSAYSQSEVLQTMGRWLEKQSKEGRPSEAHLQEVVRRYARALKKRAQEAASLWGVPGIDFAGKWAQGGRNIPTVVSSTSPKIKAGDTPHTRDLEPGSVTVIETKRPLTADEQAKLRVAGRVVRRWLNALGLSKVPLLLTVAPGFISSSLIYKEGPGGQPVFEIALSENLLQAKNLQFEFWKVLAHEIGHNVLGYMFMHADPSMQRALLKAWQEDTRKQYELAAGGKEFEAGNMRQGIGATLAGVQLNIGNDLLANLGQDELGYSSYGEIGYRSSFTEWLAYKMEQLVSTDKAMQKVMVEETRQKGVLPFLRSALRQLRILSKAYIAQARPQVPETFTDFLKGMQLYFAAKEADAQRIAAVREREFVIEGMGSPPPVVAPRKPVPLPQGAQLGGEAPMIASVDNRFNKQVDSLFQKAGLRDRRQGAFSQELDKFNLAKRWLQSLLDIAKANRHIPELYNPNGSVWPDGRTRYGYLDYVYKWNHARMQWISRADMRMQQLRKAIGWSKKRGDALRRLLFDQTVAGKYFDLSDPEVQKKYPLTPEMLELYNGMKSDFEDINKEMERILIQETLWRNRNNPFVGQKVAKIKADFEKMRSVPYFPMSRFGKYANVIYREENGELVKEGFETYDTRVQRDLAAAGLRRRGKVVNKRNASDEVMPFAGLRPEILDNLKGTLQLTPEQEKMLDEYILQMSPAQSARKHFIKRKKTPGWSQDITRAYADYFMKMGGLVARMEFQTPMNEVLGRLRETTRDISAPDTGTRQAIVDYVQRHLNYIMNPANEWQSIRAVASVMTLGLVMSSAITNLFQVPMFTAPYLQERHGAKALTELARAYKELPRLYRAGKPMRAEVSAAYDKWVTGQSMTEKEQKLVDRYFKVDEKLRDALAWGIAEGVLDQSFAMELAAMAEGGWLNKFQATSETGYRARQLLRGVMIPFELAEKVNRRVTFVAAYRLAVDQGISEEQARILAREAVQSTQFEYSKWNRPELLRGKKGSLFMFWNYQLNALTHMLGGDKSWWKTWAIMLMLVGPAGLPFADDILDFLTWLLSSENKRTDAHVELQKKAEEAAELLFGSPDLWMHGGLGALPVADYAGPLSLGDMVPLTDLLQREGDFNEKLLMGAKDGGGLMAGLVLNAARALTDDSLPMDRRIELGSPVRFLRNVMQVERWVERGATETLNGENIVEWDFNNPWDVAAVAAKLGGWQPKSVAKEQREFAARQDMVKFYQARRQLLLAGFDRALESDDADAQQQVMEAIRQYNEDVPNPGLGITGTQLQASRRARAKRRARGEADVGSTRLERGVRQELGQ